MDDKLEDSVQDVVDNIKYLSFDVLKSLHDACYGEIEDRNAGFDLVED